MRPVLRWLVFAVLAFTVGTLFRFGELTGVPLFRMFGFITLVTLVSLATWHLTRWQRQSGRTELFERLRTLNEGRLYQVPEGIRIPWLDPEVLLEHRGTYYLIASTGLPNFRGRRHGRRLRDAVVAFAGIGDRSDGFPLRHVLVLLRRRVRPDEAAFAAAHGVTLVNPEEIDRLFTPDGGEQGRAAPHPVARCAAGL